jgi:hypothetical protein
MRARIALALAVTGGLVALLPGLTGAAVPAAGSVSPVSPTTAWTGGPFVASTPTLVGGNMIACATDIDPSCDTYALTISPPPTGDYTVTIKTTATDGDDFDLYVYGPTGTRVGSSAGETGNETVTLTNPTAGTYKVRVHAWLVAAGATYTGNAALALNAAPVQDTTSAEWNWNKSAPQATVQVPLRVVLVGFEPGELDASTLLGEVPDRQRPGVLIPRGQNPTGNSSPFGGDATLVNNGRNYYDGVQPFLVPYQFEWKREVIVAPDAFSDGLFAAMKANSTTGEFASSAKRQFIEGYNATRGQYRGAAKQVPANAPVRFVDGEKVEDWIAANSQKHLGFDFAARGKGPGKSPGYTVFILNTWDSSEALQHLRPEHEYHVFKINRIDPDTNAFDGIDWARVWGGRYRFMMVDTGAAPNAYEGETWGNRGRGILGSAAMDPPLWEYRANAPRPADLTEATGDWVRAVTPGATWDKAQLNRDLGREVGQAVSFRFLHSYLYEPWPGTGKFYLSDNVWHDLHAEAPFASDLTKLYDQATVLKGLSTLTPYFEFTGDVTFEYLRDSLTGNADYAADQNMLQQAKQNGDDIAGTPFTAMNTPTAMDYVDATARLSQRGAPCATSVPGLSVVVEKHYAWSLPVIVAGIAPNRDGVPFGYLNSVSDLTKYSGADRDEAIAAIHPQAFSGAFTYTAVHEASHYLGLAHPHDSVGATRNADGSPRYYDGFTWTYNTTAAPTTYSHTELVYSILDQESIARGHAAYYLKWTDEALEDGGKAYVEAGKTLVSQLPADAQRLRSEAIGAIGKAEKLFAKFDFVNASFAAQRAWRAAAAYRDLARGLPLGTSEIEKSTKLQGAESCASAQQSGTSSTGTFMHVHDDGSTHRH